MKLVKRIWSRLERFWSRLGWWGDAIVAVGFGLAVTGIALTILPRLAGLYGYPAQAPALPAAPSSEGAVAAWLAFAQVYTGFVGIFLASALGLFALLEFIQRPKLRLSFYRTGEEPVTERWRLQITEGAVSPSVGIAVHNQGSAGTTWFQVQIFLPYARPWARSLQRLGNSRPKPDYVTALVGSREGEVGRHWRLFWDADGSVGITFMSKGEFAAFSGWPLRLGDLLVPTEPQHGSLEFKQHACPYDIVSDRSPVHRGVLYLTLERPTPSP